MSDVLYDTSRRAARDAVLELIPELKTSAALPAVLPFSHAAHHLGVSVSELKLMVHEHPELKPFRYTPENPKARLYFLREVLDRFLASRAGPGANNGASSAA